VDKEKINAIALMLPPNPFSGCVFESFRFLKNVAEPALLVNREGL
jgi:hypothetical protein